MNSEAKDPCLVCGERPWLPQYAVQTAGEKETAVCISIPNLSQNETLLKCDKKKITVIEKGTRKWQVETSKDWGDTKISA